ncbi:hypothetical protein M0P98_05245 [bacterium]|nr:hypothetical protein [bacterium]
MNQITELTFLKQLVKRSKIPVPEYEVIPIDRHKLKTLFDKWGKVVIKADVLAGKKGKAGLVKVCEDPSKVQREINKIINSEIDGKMVRTAYLSQYIPAEMEVYTAITYNTTFLSPSLTISLKGGMDIEEIDEKDKKTIPVDVYQGLNAYQASQALTALKCPSALISPFSRNLVDFWDFFISNGMRLCEINPWRITSAGKIFACDFKAVLDEANFKAKNLAISFPEYPASTTPFEEEMKELAISSHQGQIHVSNLGGKLVLPILFGGGSSTIIIETLMNYGGDPIFLSDFGGNPSYDRMHDAASICFKHHIKNASLLLILGGKANNTMIDVTFQAIANALSEYVEENGPVHLPVIIGRGGPRLAKGMSIMKDTLESLGLPYIIFGYDTPVTMVAEYAAKLANAFNSMRKNESKDIE